MDEPASPAAPADPAVPGDHPAEAGPVIAEIVVGDEPDTWRAGGFAVDGDTCTVGAVRIRLVGREQGKRILEWSVAGVAATSGPGFSLPADELGTLDGLPTRLAPAPAPAPPAGGHPNGVLIIDHIVVISPDGPRTTAAFEAVGWPTRATRDTDTYGAPMRQSFFKAGGVIVELIAPKEAGTGTAGFFGLAYTVADLDATATLLGAGLGRVKDAVQPGRRIATLRHRDVGMSVATAFMSGEPVSS